MSIENRPQIVSDTGCLIPREPSSIKEMGLTYAPLNISFYENGNWVTYDDNEISPEEFYRRMKQSEKLPKTSGVVTGKLLNIFDSHVQEDKSTISIHITSRHSAVHDSAILAKNLIEEKYPRLFSGKNPHLFINIIDSRQISVAAGFLAEHAASLANQGYPLRDINRLLLETVPKTEMFLTLNSFENVTKGGRFPTIVGTIGDSLQIKPFLYLADGELKVDKRRSMTRTSRNARRELINKVESTKEKIVRLAIVHTNFTEGAEELKEALSQLYSGEIEIYEAGPVLGVHAGEKGLGIALQKA